MCFMVRSMFYLGWIFIKGLRLEFSFLHVGVQLFQHHLLNRLSLFHSAIFPLSKSRWLCFGASLVAQMAKNLSTMQDTWVQSLGWEDSLEKGMATHSSILAWKIPWTGEPGRLQPMGFQRIRRDWSDLACTQGTNHKSFSNKLDFAFYICPSIWNIKHRS